jgi:hypothetical protein
VAAPRRKVLRVLFGLLSPGRIATRVNAHAKKKNAGPIRLDAAQLHTPFAPPSTASHSLLFPPLVTSHRFNGVTKDGLRRGHAMMRRRKRGGDVQQRRTACVHAARGARRLSLLSLSLFPHLDKVHPAVVDLHML